MSVEYQAEYLVGNVKGASGVRLENEAVVEGVDRVVIGLLNEFEESNFYTGNSNFDVITFNWPMTVTRIEPS